MPTQRPIGNYNFRVEIDGVSAGYFKSVEGLDAGSVTFQRKWGDITLKKGYVNSTAPLGLKAQPGTVMHKVAPASPMQLKAAGRLLIQGFVLDQNHGRLLQHWVSPGAPRTPIARGQIVMTDYSGKPIRRYNFYQAWPCKWYVPELDGSSTIELAVGKLTPA
jgi:T4-like virus tail tube protein gp19